MHVIFRTISSFFPHQKILFLSKVMLLKICDTSPGFSISIGKLKYQKDTALMQTMLQWSKCKNFQSFKLSLPNVREFQSHEQTDK